MKNEMFSGVVGVKRVGWLTRTSSQAVILMTEMEAERRLLGVRLMSHVAISDPVHVALVIEDQVQVKYPHPLIG